MSGGITSLENVKFSQVFEVMNGWVPYYTVPLLSAKKKKMAGNPVDRWLEIVQECQYLPENELKARVFAAVIGFQGELFLIRTATVRYRLGDSD